MQICQVRIYLNFLSKNFTINALYGPIGIKRNYELFILVSREAISVTIFDFSDEKRYRGKESSALSQKFARKFCHGPEGGSMDAAKIGGKAARPSASAYIPRWNAGPSTKERVSSNLFSFQEKQRFTPPLAGRKHRLILARTARLRPDLQKGFLLVKEFTTQDT